MYNRRIVMKVLIVYHSTYKNNTEKVAKVFANKVGADLINLKNAEVFNIDDYDIIGFGSGVYKESMSYKLYKCVERLDLKNKNVFVFSTSGLGMKFYNKKLINLLKSKEAVCKGSFSCKGNFKVKDFGDNKIFELMGKLAEGHPNDSDLHKAERFIENIVK
jgi:flavodoxin